MDTSDLNFLTTFAGSHWYINCFPCLVWLNILIVWQGEPEELELEEAELFEDQSLAKKQKTKKAAAQAQVFRQGG